MPGESTRGAVASMPGTTTDCLFGEALVRSVFGSDDGSSDDGNVSDCSADAQISEQPPPVFIAPDRYRHVGPLSNSIPGLELCRGALTMEAQQWLVSQIDAEHLVELPTPLPGTVKTTSIPTEAPSRVFARDAETQPPPLPESNRRRANQSMRFGNFPNWAHTLSCHVKTIALSDATLPIEIARRGETREGKEAKKRKKTETNNSRQALFDQLIVNAYTPGEGLAPHVDLHAFDDGVVVVSLLATVVMDFYAPQTTETTTRQKKQKVDGTEQEEDARMPKNHASTDVRAISQKYLHAPYPHPSPIGLRLDPGDVLFLSGDARWRWRHGIAARTVDGDRRDGGGEEGGNTEKSGVAKRGFRLSVTLRALREEGRELRVNAGVAAGS